MRENVQYNKFIFSKTAMYFFFMHFTIVKFNIIKYLQIRTVFTVEYICVSYELYQ